MKLTVVGLGGKHELEVKAADTLAAVKAQLAPLVSLPPEELKLVAKGKAPPDATPLSALGLADGGKLMLMRSQAGAKSLQQRGKAAAPASATSANSRPLGAPPWLSIGCEVDYLDSGGERHSAALLAPLVSGGAEPAAMRLLAKGKEAADDATDGVARLAELRERVGKLTLRLRKRLLDAAEAQVQLGALEEELNAISLDLKNAAPNETSDAAAVRRERLAECARVGDELSAARKEHADALLGAQLGR
ncbi:hypothetical protein EMIHUDRAFT_468532 [Emiliania huxleyi CCMP1516]|uniref:Ubiquitin-like domain-containing protein n=2 Tax=Emiliania huxleyi TaxID=2903 RepID=A0A0D3K1C7_EMIH1|nr:hypothetical protein EMIHUDRAFT_468532 [Emiliania huxleyi CCMP1516]EOD29562.1 hypothetical protein EMIHUDRAFT_468532 [Emiliania huxleyi CCMP1516]|eukprot:XP_005781991.1 hypothetical protein EMIHUDRAFT_468532 [Emiliania huxleyi CCMP1516]